MRFRREFAGEPYTRPYKRRKVGIGYRTALSELTPLRAKIADFLAGVTGYSIAIGGTWFGMKADCEDLFYYLSMIFGPIIFYPIIQWYWRTTWERQLLISQDGLRVKVHRLWPSRPYKTHEVGGYTLVTHVKAQREAEKHQERIAEAAAKGVRVNPTPYYQHSFTIMVNYNNEFFPVMSIYRPERAERAFYRLQAIYTKIAYRDEFGGEAIPEQLGFAPEPGTV